MKAPKKTINVLVNPTKKAIERIASIRFIRGYDDRRIKKHLAKLDGCTILYPSHAEGCCCSYQEPHRLVP